MTALETVLATDVERARLLKEKARVSEECEGESQNESAARRTRE